MASGFDELDAFWDIGSLMPRKTKKTISPFSSGPKMADVVTDGTTPSKGAEENCRLNLDTAKSAKTVTYQPSYNSLITSVSITRQENRYGFYADFRKDAIAWMQLPAEKCAFVPFFSYAPQHSQLNDAQRSYYLWWRKSARDGEFLPCDYSYFWLFVYEIINLADVIPPKEGAPLLARLWSAYHKTLPRINKYMAVWLADYCLVNAVPCPHEELRSFLPVVLENATLKEFYLWGTAELTDVGIVSLLALLSEYDWQNSRYAKEHALLFSEHLPRAMEPLLRNLLDNGHIFYSENASVLTGHTAFSCALCAGQTKCILTVRGCSFSHMGTVRATVTAAVKHAENCLRAYLSLRSRLAVPADFSPYYRRMIDAYFASNLQKKKEKTEKEPPVYEALYEAPRVAADFSVAEEIESHSWDVTKLLVSEDSLEEPIELSPAVIRESEDGLSVAEKRFLAALLEQNVAAAQAAVEDASAAFEHINELALLSEIGDVVLSFDGESYGIVEDYEEEVRKWIA